MNIKHVAGNTYCIESIGSLIPFYMLDDKNIILIDCGHKSERAELIGLLKKNDLCPRAVLVTHSHSDHIGNLGYLRIQYGAQSVTSFFDAAAMQNPLSLLCTRHLDNYLTIQKKFDLEGLESDIFYYPGQNTIDVCGKSFGVFHTPGHAFSQDCFITPDDVMCMGDTIVGEDYIKNTKLLYMDNYAAALESMERIKSEKHTAYLISHREIVLDDISSLAEKNVIYIKNQLNYILQRMGGPVSKEELVYKVCDGFISINSPERYMMIEMIIRRALEHFQYAGEIGTQIIDNTLKYSVV